MKNKKLFYILCFIFVSFLITNFIYTKFTSKEVIVNHGNYEFFIKYLIVDKEKVTKDMTIDDTFDNKYVDNVYNILYSSYARIFLKKEGNNYVGKIDNVNEDVYKNINDYVFALNDINGNVVTDAKFDLNKNEIIIPKKYINDAKNGFNLHLQVMSRLTKDEIRNIKVTSKINGTNKKITYQNTYSKNSKFSIKKYGNTRSIKKSDITVVINKQYKLPEENFSWNARSGVITLNTDAIVLNDVNIYLKNNSIIEKSLNTFLNIIRTDASNDLVSFFKLNTAPTNVSTGTTFNFSVNKSSDEFIYAPKDGNQGDISDDEESSIRYLYGDGYLDMNNAYLHTINEQLQNANNQKINSNWYSNYVGSGTSNLVEFKINLPQKLTNGNKEINFGSRVWIYLMCGHSSSGASNNTVNLKAKVLDYDNNAQEITILFYTTEETNTQFGFGIYKFYWSQKSAKITINKTFTQDPPSDKSGISFTLYNGATCSGNKIKTVKTNSSGKAVFKNITCGNSYSVKETKMGSDYLSKNYTPKNECVVVTATCNGTQSGVYNTNMDYENRRRYWCVSVRKTSLNDGCTLNDVQFSFQPTVWDSTQNKQVSSGQSPFVVDTGHKLNSKNNTTTAAAAGEAIVEYLDYSNFDIRETQSSPFSSYCSGTLKTYFNSNTSLVVNRGPREMTYSEDINGNGTYTCPTATTTDINGHWNFTDTEQKQRYCAAIKKVDSETNQPLAGARFEIVEYNGTTSENPLAIIPPMWNGDLVADVETSPGSGLYVKSKTTSDGMAYFLLGQVPNPIKIKETRTPSGYLTNNEEITITKVIALDYDEENPTPEDQLLATCKALATPTESDPTERYTTITNSKRASLLNFYKTDADNNRLNGVKFLVRQKYTNSGVEATDDNAYYVKLAQPSDQSTWVTDSSTPTITKNCYKAVGRSQLKKYEAEEEIVSESSSGYVIQTYNTETTPGTTSNGEICISGLYENLDYEVIELLPDENHTFGEQSSKIIKSSNEFASQTNSNTFTNYNTRVEFTKEIYDKYQSQLNNERPYSINGSSQMTLKDITENQVKQIPFKVTDMLDNVYYFSKNTDNNEYEYYNSDGIDDCNYLSNDYSKNVCINEDNIVDKNNQNIIIASSNLKLFKVQDKLKIIINKIPQGDYNIQEMVSDSSNTCYKDPKYQEEVINDNSYSTADGNYCNASSSSECIGYYAPGYSVKFTVSECSSENAKSSEYCRNKSLGFPQGTVKPSLTNFPTEVTLTKKDFYKENDESDKNTEFASDEERNEFDQIDFKIYRNITDSNSSANALNLIYIGNFSSTPGREGESVTCDSDTDFALYRYVPGLVLPNSVSSNTFNNNTYGVTQTIHTCGGHIKIQNLCKGTNFIFKEEKLPENSIFARSDNQDYYQNVQGNTTGVNCFSVPCESEDKVKISGTKLIENKGTRVRFEKRDSKYGYLINDETTTFKVYKCKNDSCTEREEIKFVPRHVLESSKIITHGCSAEDPNITYGSDEEDYNYYDDNYYGVYVRMSDSKSNSNFTPACQNDLINDPSANCYVTTLHPDSGVLILRYLQAGYKYVLVETVAPQNYDLPMGANAETIFEVTNETVSVDEVDVPNKPTAVVLRKYDDNGNLITGAKFKVYEKLTSVGDSSKLCSNSIPVKDQAKQLLSLKTIYGGIYEARPLTDTNIITTCTNTSTVNCNNLTSTLIADKYQNSWLGLNNGSLKSPNNVELFNPSINASESYTQIQQGEALIQYLEYGHCYIFEEIEPPKGYSLPKNEDDRWSYVNIEENDTYDHSTFKTFVNTPTPYQFYKYDEFNELLDGAKFKLQKLNTNKVYEDITVEVDEDRENELKDSDGNKTVNVYKVSSNTENKEIETINGTAMIYYLEPGQYRILEIEPAPGKELGKNQNVATFFVTKQGEVYGNRIITNKEKTKKYQRIMSDSAELIVSTQTGQTLIKYGLVIGIILTGTIGLMIYRRKKGDKK